MAVANQSSPNSLTVHELRYLLALCDDRVNHCSLLTEEGRRARAMAYKLTACIVTFPRRRRAKGGKR